MLIRLRSQLPGFDINILKKFYLIKLWVTTVGGRRLVLFITFLLGNTASCTGYFLNCGEGYPEQRRVSCSSMFRLPCLLFLLNHKNNAKNLIKCNSKGKLFTEALVGGCPTHLYFIYYKYCTSMYSVTFHLRRAVGGSSIDATASCTAN